MAEGWPGLLTVTRKQTLYLIWQDYLLRETGSNRTNETAHQYIWLCGHSFSTAEIM